MYTNKDGSNIGGILVFNTEDEEGMEFILFDNLDRYVKLVDP